MRGDPTPRSARGVYGISVASELSGIPPQTLRHYERRGLLTPARSDGGTRRYSDDDLARLKRISQLVDQGVNLVGVAHILDLESKNDQLKADYSALELLNAKLKTRQNPERAASPRQCRGEARREAV
ncbi:MerR family transcriptional regulator [Mycobacterium avium]|uniref:MerR family transcriptional regulator n=1 Tax=Mycobacterium avium TaxID=1764 RepID=UPI0002E6D794|nr:helix-turn-helix transcriptional regulator [Mycobacterium avium]AGL37042.1 merR-family heat shock protein transcriptional repressor hspR [Mycobacterium avium subsp. paratuberculosis MAP4]